MDFIHRYIPAKSECATTLVLLHGTGGNEEDLLPLGQFLSPDAALLGIRGKVLENGMPRFFRRLSEGVFDEKDLLFRTYELARFVEEVTETYHLNPGRLVAVGYSNGANIAASMLLLEQKLFREALLLRAMVPFVPEKLPCHDGTRVLMLSGRQDPIIPAENSERLARLLQEAGMDVTHHWTDTGHGLLQPELAFAKDWLSRLL